MSEMSQAQAPSSAGASDSQPGSGQPDPQDEELGTADGDPDRNEPAEADLIGSEEPASDSTPEIAGTGS